MSARSAWRARRRAFRHELAVGLTPFAPELAGRPVARRVSIVTTLCVAAFVAAYLIWSHA